MKLKIDNREKRLIKLLELYKKEFDLKNIECTVEKLDLGDFIICDDDGNEKLIIERKSLNDLASSIKDGRYVEQSHRLTGYNMHNHNIIYLIEGDLSTWVNKYKVQSNTLYTALFSLNYYKGFSVIRTMDINETAEYILRMCDSFIGKRKRFHFMNLERKMEKNTWM